MSNKSFNWRFLAGLSAKQQPVFLSEPDEARPHIYVLGKTLPETLATLTEKHAGELKAWLEAVSQKEDPKELELWYAEAHADLFGENKGTGNALSTGLLSMEQEQHQIPISKAPTTAQLIEAVNTWHEAQDKIVADEIAKAEAAKEQTPPATEKGGKKSVAAETSPAKTESTAVVVTTAAGFDQKLATHLIEAVEGLLTQDGNVAKAQEALDTIAAANREQAARTLGLLRDLKISQNTPAVEETTR